MSPLIQPMALFGWLLKEAAPVYYIYTDEAGTSAKEPVTVVVGVIIHADRHWRAASDRVQQVIDIHVPAKLRPGFVSHGKQIWAGYRDYDDVWPKSDRAAFIGAMAAIPRELRMAISIGIVRRNSSTLNHPKLRLHDFHHLWAFRSCIFRANKYVRDWADLNEVATVVAEDVTDKRRLLKQILNLELPSLPLNEEYVRPSAADRAAGRILQTNAGPLDKIIDTVHFAEKDEAPLLQIADACAFSFRRYFAEQNYGQDLVRLMLGRNLVLEDWQGPFSEMTFSFNPDHAYPKLGGDDLPKF